MMAQYFNRTFRFNNALILAFYSLILPNLFGQNLPLLNQRSIGGSNDDNLNYAGKTSGSSSIWMYGNSSSSVNGTHTVPGYGNRDAWIVKFDSNLNPVAQFGFGGTADEVSQSVLLGDDYVLWAGFSFSGISGNKTVPDYGMGDGYIIKMDTIGNVLWQEHYGGTESDALADVQPYTDSSFVALLGTQSGVSGNKTTPLIGVNDLWLIEIALSDGHIIRQKTISSTYSDYALQIKPLSNGHLIIVAEAFAGVGGDKTDYGFGDPQTTSDIWILELDNNWTILRDKCFGGDSQEEAGRIFQFNSRTFLLCTTYSQPSGQIVNPTFTDNGYPDVWFCEVDDSWNILEEKTYGGTNYDQSGWLANISDNSFLLTINSRSLGGTGNKTSTSYGLSDTWTIWLDENLNERNQISFGSSGSDGGYFAPYNGDNLLLIASSDGGISGNKTVSTFGALDAWLGTVDFGSVLALKEHQNDLVNVFPNPFENTLNISGIDLAISEISVFNALGQQQSCEVTGQQIKIENLVPGVYTLIATEKNTGNVLVRKKVVRR